jgi:hypothetical protein
MRGHGFAIGLVLLGMAVDGWAADGSAAAVAEPVLVQARVEKAYYAVGSATAKESRATDAIVLENEYIKAIILPEFAARLPRVTFKQTGRDLFCVNDVVGSETSPMGGARFALPPYDRAAADSAAGWRIARLIDGGATVAMDMRFTQYTGPRAAGQFSTLRQAVFVTLRPGTSVLEYTARLDNRLPLAHGFRLWGVAAFPRVSGAALLMPVSSVTDAEATTQQPWPLRGDAAQLDVFGVEPQGDWFGVYYPQGDANHLVLRPRYTAPGTRLYARRQAAASDAEASPAGDRLECWVGSNPTVAHPGHFLPPFGTYTLPLRLALVTGIGRIQWTNDNVAISYEVRGEGVRIGVATFQDRPVCTLEAQAGTEVVKAEGPLVPGRPLFVEFAKRPESVAVSVVQGKDEELATVTLPWRPAPTSPESFQAIAAEMKPWGPVAMELADWTPGRHNLPNLAEAAAALTNGLSSDKPAQVLQAARVIMRAEPPGSERWRLVRNALDTAVARGSKNRHAAEYLGMMMAMETSGRMPPEAVKYLSTVPKMPGAQYLLALDAVAANPARAITLWQECVATAPPVAMGLGDDDLEGNNRLHPASTIGGEWPTLLAAAQAIELKRLPTAIPALERLLLYDPGRPEALALLGEAYTKADQPTKAYDFRADAERLFQRNEQARRDFEALLLEARQGIWPGIPRP